mgnify:CR=1 FL=1
MRMHRSVAVARSSRLASEVQDDVRFPQRGEESPEGADFCTRDEHLPRDPTGHQARPSDIHAQAAGHQAADHPFDVGKALGPLAGRKGMDAITGCVEMDTMASLQPSLSDSDGAKRMFGSIRTGPEDDGQRLGHDRLPSKRLDASA